MNLTIGTDHMPLCLFIRVAVFQYLSVILDYDYIQEVNKMFPQKSYRLMIFITLCALLPYFSTG